MKKVIIVGGGEQGRVVADAIISGLHSKVEPLSIEGYLDDANRGPIMGRYLGPIKGAEYLSGESYVVALGDNHFRGRLIEEIEKSGGVLKTVIHNSAIISPSCKIERGTFIGSGAVLANNSEIRKGAIVDDCALVGHDSVLGRYANVSPRGTLVSGNKIGDYSWIGAGAIINEDIPVGSNSIVGAGSLVLKGVEDNMLVFGSPAKAEGAVDSEGKHTLEPR